MLLTDEGPVWDSLAIAEYLAEVAPKAQLWPQSVMHERWRAASVPRCSGFQALRSHLPMDMARDQALAQLPEAVQEDIDRICAIWADCRGRFGHGGAYLFGQPGVADAFYAPVASRLRSYRVELPPVATAYVETIHQWPAFQRWRERAVQEVMK